MKASDVTLQVACDIAIREGITYSNKLANKRFLVIYRDRESGNIKNLEVVFKPSNFQHLTGLDLVDKNNRVIKRSAVGFYHKCVSGKLLPTEIKFRDEYTTSLKLECLPRLTEFTRITRIAGEYNQSKPRLQGEYLLGGTSGCIAITMNEDGDYYYPRSAINEDIRKLTKSSSQVLAILETEHDPRVEEFVYDTIRYQAKGVDITRVKLPEELQEMVFFDASVSEKQKRQSAKTERKKSIIERLQENQRIIEEREKSRGQKPKRSRSASIED